MIVRKDILARIVQLPIVLSHASITELVLPKTFAIAKELITLVPTVKSRSAIQRVKQECAALQVCAIAREQDGLENNVKFQLAIHLVFMVCADRLPMHVIVPPRIILETYARSQFVHRLVKMPEFVLLETCVTAANWKVGLDLDVTPRSAEISTVHILESAQDLIRATVAKQDGQERFVRLTLTNVLIQLLRAILWLPFVKILSATTRAHLSVELDAQQVIMVMAN